MNIFKQLLAKPSKRVIDTEHEIDPSWPGRKLRTFDIECCAPYDHKGVVAFLRADKLSDLTTAQIKIFLLLRDTLEPEGLTTFFIAGHLEMSKNTVRSCLAALKRKGYARHSDAEQISLQGSKVVSWICDSRHWVCDEESLFWEFGEI